MDNIGNEITNNTFSKIASKFILVLKLQSEALAPPTFSTNIIEQLNQIFNQIQDFSEKVKDDEKCDQLLFQKIAELIPDIEELINQNYLQYTVVSFQAKLNEVYTAVKKVMINSPQFNSKFESIIDEVKKAVSRSYSCGFTKLSSSYFTDLQAILKNLDTELTSLNTENENESSLTETIPPPIIHNISNIFNQALSILNHLNAANTIISKTYSLIKTIKKVQPKSPHNQLPIQSHKILVSPSKPKLQSDQMKALKEPKTENVEKLINEFQSDPRGKSKIDEYAIKFDLCIKGEFVFFPPTMIFQSILRSINGIIIPEDMDADRFGQFSELFQSLSQMMLLYYQLPDSINRSSDISSFNDQTNDFEASIETNKGSFDEFFIRSLHEFLLYCKFVKTAAETVDNVNRLLGQNLVVLDLQPLHVLRPSRMISTIQYQKVTAADEVIDDEEEKKPPKKKNINCVNAFRSLNVISKDVVALRHRGIEIVTDPRSYEIHPVSIFPQLIRLRDTIRDLERQLYLHLRSFSDLDENTKSGESFFNAFEIISFEANDFYSSICSCPLSCVDLRIKTLLLYQQRFPISNEESVQVLLNFYSLIYDVYVSFCKLDEIGTISISSSIQLSYILTMCDDLADHYPCFNKYLRFFNSVDLFNIDNEKVIKFFKKLKRDLLESLSNCNLNDLLAQIVGHSKEIASSLNKLAKNNDSKEIVGLIGFLNAWIESDSNYKRKCNLKEIQIQMDLLKKLVSQKASENNEFARSFDFEAVCEVCDLFAKMRDTIDERSRIRSFLSFVECSQNYEKGFGKVTIGQIESIAPELRSDREDEENDNGFNMETASGQKVASQETVSNCGASSGNNNAKSEQNQSTQKQANLSKKKFDVFTNEKARQVWFDMYSPQLFDNQKEGGIIDCVVPSLVHCHFVNVVVKYCHFLSLGDSFIQSVSEAFGEMVQEPVNKGAITKEELQEYFGSNRASFKSFIKSTKPEITAQFDLVIQCLNVIGSKLKGRDSHLNDIVKKLNAIRSSFKFSRLEWLNELVQCYRNVMSLLKENQSMTSLLFNVYSSFQRLNNMIYYCLLIRRCFSSIDSDHIQCQFDTSLHLSYLDNFSESDHLISESSSMIVQDQIHFILGGEVGSSPIQLEASMKILRLFGQIVNLPLILNTIETEFFNFEKFFAKLPHQLTGLQVLINSALFSSANYAKKSLFRLIATGFTVERYECTIRSFERLKSELKAAPFDVELQPINEVISACNAFMDLSQIALIDDSLSTFCACAERPPESHGYVPGLDVFDLRVKMFSVQSKLLKLSKIKPDQYDCTMRSFLRNFSTSYRIPDLFGVYDSSDPTFTKFVRSWGTFVSSLAPIDLSEVYDELRHSTRVIISVLNDSGHKDMAPLKTLDQLFQATHDVSLLFKMRLSFLYVRKHLVKYTRAYKESELPFDQIDSCLQVLMIHEELFVLIQQTTNLLNGSFNLEEPIQCLSSFTIDHKKDEEQAESGGSDEDDNEEEGVVIDGRRRLFNLADQTSLAQMAHITAVANQKDQERLSGLPILVEEVCELKSQVKQAQRPIDQLDQIVALMNELLDIVNSQAPNGNEVKDRSSDSCSQESKGSISKSNILKRDLVISSQHYQSLMHQYENMVKMSLKLDEENDQLLNEITVKFEKGINFIARNKSDRYNKLFSLLNKSYDIVKKAFDTMVLISNDQYTKGEFDSPFDKNLLSVGQNRNPINLRLVFLKEKLQDVMKEKGLKSNSQDDYQSVLQNFANDFNNMDYKDQIGLLQRLKNRLKNEIDIIKKGNP